MTTYFRESYSSLIKAAKYLTGDLWISILEQFGGSFFYGVRMLFPGLLFIRLLRPLFKRVFAKGLFTFCREFGASIPQCSDRIVLFLRFINEVLRGVGVYARINGRGRICENASPLQPILIKELVWLIHVLKDFRDLFSYWMLITIIGHVNFSK